MTGDEGGSMPNGARGGFSSEQAIPDWLVFGRSKAMLEVRSAVERVAAVSVPVLIQGEKGTGKEIIAREIHVRSTWCAGTFLKLECRALGPENGLLESSRRVSSMSQVAPFARVDFAHSGTLFFDEISQAEPAVQAQLVSVLEENEWRYNSTTDTGQPQVRIICATEVDLEKRIALGYFRSDLYYRISVVKIQLPRLRDRSEDIADLAEYFLGAHRRPNVHRSGFSPALLRLLCAYDWPDNIRQLEECVALYVNTGNERAIIDEVLGQPMMNRCNQDSVRSARHSRS